MALFICAEVLLFATGAAELDRIWNELEIAGFEAVAAFRADTAGKVPEWVVARTAMHRVVLRLTLRECTEKGNWRACGRVLSKTDLFPGTKLGDDFLAAEPDEGERREDELPEKADDEHACEE